MKVNFTEQEKKLLKGQGAAIARKHGCSNMYVLYILRGEREIKSELSKAILKDLRILLTFLKPTGKSKSN